MRTTVTSDWDNLNCLFFASTCRRILNDYFEAHGFVESPNLRGVGVLYRWFDIFLEVGYEPITCPDYSPTIVLGTGPDIYDESGLPACVPFWYVIPDSLPESGYSLWTFRDEAQLKGVLVRIKVEILEPHAKPLWLSLDRLENCISGFRDRS
jgi:hypothetical protein